MTGWRLVPCEEMITAGEHALQQRRWGRMRAMIDNKGGYDNTDKTICEDGIEAYRAMISASPPPAISVEEVARVIDPEAWRQRDGYLERAELWVRRIAESGENDARLAVLRGNRANAESCTKDSLTKARTILAMVQPNPTLASTEGS